MRCAHGSTRRCASQAARSRGTQTPDQFRGRTRELSSIHVSGSTKRASEMDFGLVIAVVMIVVMVVVMGVIVVMGYIRSIGDRGHRCGGDPDGYHDGGQQLLIIKPRVICNTFQWLRNRAQPSVLVKVPSGSFSMSHRVKCMFAAWSSTATPVKAQVPSPY